MFEYVEIMLEEFLTYLPMWGAIVIALSIAGSAIFKKI